MDDGRWTMDDGRCVMRNHVSRFTFHVSRFNFQALDSEGLMATEVRTEAKHRTAGAPFDPDRLAYLEVTGLRAYYDHKWFLMLKLVVQVMREQFGFSLPRALQAAYLVTRGSIAWAPAD